MAESKDTQHREELLVEQSRTGRKKATSQRRRHTNGALTLRHQDTINTQNPNQMNGSFVSAALRKIDALNNHLFSGCCKTSSFIPSESFLPLDSFKGKNLW